ncbi:hypothetical protein KTJ89_06795 [Brevibacterium sediminis]|uniref:hypothetical protein n=1 Tax=Brevibacterium sediminis TaxID=1857024 RepID=UPI002174EC5F|nr:hypothetical protein [Brevibacterium sediminis]MCS4592691.1 hypothetical protein [Brevibacterium sediminis]
MSEVTEFFAGLDDRSEVIGRVGAPEVLDNPVPPASLIGNLRRRGDQLGRTFPTNELIPP